MMATGTARIAVTKQFGHVTSDFITTSLQQPMQFHPMTIHHFLLTFPKKQCWRQGNRCLTLLEPRIDSFFKFFFY